MDLTALTGDEFTDHERTVRMDRERPDNLARIPDTITDLSRAYTESGGDTADLVDALSPEQPALQVIGLGTGVHREVRGG